MINTLIIILLSVDSCIVIFGCFCLIRICRVNKPNIKETQSTEANQIAINNTPEKEDLSNNSRMIKILMNNTEFR